MMEYVEVGGLRWGQSYWQAANASWPFAKLKVTGERLILTVRFWPFPGEHGPFEFDRADVRQLRRKRGLLGGRGIVVEHTNADSPPFILFWTFHFNTLAGTLRRLDYEILDA